MLLAIRFNVCPAHIAELDPAVGAAGIGLTVTDVVPAGPVQPFTVAVTEYTPVAAAVAEAIGGFCKALVKPLGPVQA
jgi:hypothetical protein